MNRRSLRGVHILPCVVFYAFTENRNECYVPYIEFLLGNFTIEIQGSGPLVSVSLCRQRRSFWTFVRRDGRNIRKTTSMDTAFIEL